MKKNPEERLGYKEDLKEIMEHPWFSDVDWDALLKKQIQAPFKPTFASDFSTEYFDDEFTSEGILFWIWVSFINFDIIEAINSITSTVDPEVLQEFDDQFRSMDSIEC